MALGRQILVDALQPRLEERLEIDTAGWLDAGPIERGVRDVYRGRLTVHVRVLVVHHHVAQVDDLPGLVQRSFVGTDRHVHHVFGARRAAGLQQRPIDDLQHRLVRLDAQHHSVGVAVRTSGGCRGGGVVGRVEHCRLAGNCARCS